MPHHRSPLPAERSADPQGRAHRVRSAVRARLRRPAARRARPPSDVELRRRTVAAIESDVHVRIAADRVAVGAGLGREDAA